MRHHDDGKIWGPFSNRSGHLHSHSSNGEIVKNKGKITVVDRMKDSEAMTRAMGEAIQENLREHKLLGQPIVVWKDGRVVWIPAEEIELPPDKPSSDVPTER
jgi:isoaspartyl peptidase/L-asparaginase-like protein (Ntn-hydrolase superfamily)